MSASASGGSGKMCVVCGEDVAGKPRTKDSHGRYYCQPCYDKAIAQKHAKRAAVPLPKVTPPRADSHGVQDDGPAHILEDLLDMQPPAAQLSMPCPACHQSIPAGGIICTHCGYNVQTQESVVGKVKVKSQRQAGGALWPPIVGIISMVLGGGGVLVYGGYFVLALVRVVNAGATGPALLSILPVGSLLTALAAWLFRDGLRILRRDPDGVKWIRIWAVTKLLIYGSCLAVIMAIPMEQLEKRLTSVEAQYTATEIKSSILLVMLWYLAWPAFVLVFFFVPRIRADVDAWD